VYDDDENTLWETEDMNDRQYDEKDDPCAHLEKWAQAYGVKPQLEWVHLFYHTLDVIPMNW